jgi:hypothetical protein
VSGGSRKGEQLNSFLGKQVLSAVTLVVVVAATTLVVPAEEVFNEQSIPPIPRTYRGVPLDIRKASNGDRVPLGTIIYTPPPTQEGYVQLEFPREILSKGFVDEFFLNRSSGLRSVHPFSQRGMESILTKNSLIIRLHLGVILHLRNDIPNSPDYKTFSVDNPRARLVTFGHETYLGKPKTSEIGRLRELFLEWRPKECVPENPQFPHGPTRCPPGEYFPKMYEPRVE